MLLRRSLSLCRVFDATSIPRFYATRASVTVGMRREDPQRIWERRAPLSPKAVKELVEGGVNVEIEHCDRRVFRDQEYTAVGAHIVPSLDNSHIIVGIKETPLNEVITSPIPPPPGSPPRNHAKVPRTHLMFSHTAKGQPYNTPLLAKYVTAGSHTDDSLLLPRLIDYELLTDEVSGKRTVGFGWFAGGAQSTPRPHTHPTLQSIQTALRAIGQRVTHGGIPDSLGPFIIGLTGTGNVAQGCLDILSELPIQKVEVADLHALVTNPKPDMTKVYLCHASPKDYFVRLDGESYERSHYYSNPQLYRSTFCETVAPYLTLFLNGTGWSTNFPRLMTNEQLSIALDKARLFRGARFTNIGDISCDIEGGLQFLTRATTLSSPFYKISPPPIPGANASLPSVQMMSVDILPTSLPLDASYHFSRELFPYVESLIREYQTGQEDQYTDALRRATIAENGELTTKHQWLLPGVQEYYYNQKEASHSTTADLTVAEPATPVQRRRVAKKKLLMLGSGMVARPAVEHISKRDDVQLIVAGNSLIELEQLAQEFANIQYRVVDSKDEDGMSSLIQEADAVISLLPAFLHVGVANLCLKHRAHLITASYTSPEMRQLNSAARGKGLIFLNEIGLDPGIDHCSALDLIAKIRSSAQRVQSFTSFCGGLPAPDVEYTPLRYKFSWSPKGVLLAGLNGAKYLLNGEISKIGPGNLFQSQFPNVPITDQFELEGLPNRDSLLYRTKKYGLTDVNTLVRGTLRYPGFSSLMESFKDLGLLNNVDKIRLPDWQSFVKICLEKRLRTDLSTSTSAQHSYSEVIADLIPSEKVSELHTALEWLGLLPTPVYSYNKPLPPLPFDPMTPLEIFAYLLAHQCAYKAHERDMVVLSHEVIANDLETGEKWVYTSSLIEYGTPKASAMARTVGIPVAIAALLVLDKKISMRGVIGPFDRCIYQPVLNGMKAAGIHFKKTKTLWSPSLRTVESSLEENSPRITTPRKHNPLLPSLVRNSRSTDEKLTLITLVGNLSSKSEPSTASGDQSGRTVESVPPEAPTGESAPGDRSH
ncbi:hypothetical protein H0H93_007002 [Arthromyces matolae]|nr:hypothetical protein H0H93_007002 [Arthromyces matolae]